MRYRRRWPLACDVKPGGSSTLSARGLTSSDGRAAGQPNPMFARNLAMVHAAIYNAVNAIDRRLREGRRADGADDDGTDVPPLALTQEAH